MYLALKSAHIISFVCWFAGLFYLVRLFIYLVETNEESVRNQLVIMARRLWLGITVPAAWATLIFGLMLMMSSKSWHAPWFSIKLGLLFLLGAYHFYCRQIFVLIRNQRWNHGSRWLRVYNEVATLFLFTIVPVAVSKQPLWAIWGIVSWFALGLLVFGVSIIKKKFD